MIRKDQVVVVMVPLAAQGHLNQLLHLSRLIYARDIPVHYIGAATHNRQAKLRIHGWDPSELANLHFHDVSIPPFSSPPPDPTAATKFPAHLIPSFRAAAVHLREPLTNLVRSLSSHARRIIVIHDSLMASTVDDIDSIPNAESYNFHSVSAFTMAIYDLELQEQVKGNYDQNSIIKDLNVPSLDGCFTPEFWEFVELQFQTPRKFSGNLYNTCRAIEEPYLEILQAINHETRHWAIGPFNPVELGSTRRVHPCLEWLDQQQTNSVVYVSFGTTTAFKAEQIAEIAGGLERSEQKFIWVLRDADKGDVFEGEVRRSELPEGFEIRVASRGLVVRDWAPQLEILSHGSTGGFVSHCGWNSCIESITMGVPIIAWPMHSDQPRNSVLMTQVLKVGLLIRDWARRDELVTATTIENAVRKQMVSEEGREMRKRAEGLSATVQRSLADGGVSRVEFDSFVAHITREI